MNIVAFVEQEVREASEALPLTRHMLDDTALQLLLDGAVKVIDSAGKSLTAVQNKDEAVQQRKKEVMILLKNLDSRVSQLGSLLPPRQPDTSPIMVDAGEKRLQPFQAPY